jgi:hypothetical protein
MHDILMTSVYTFIVLGGSAIGAYWLAGAYVRTRDIQRDDDGLTNRICDDLERELSEYGASKGNDGRRV